MTTIPTCQVWIISFSLPSITIAIRHSPIVLPLPMIFTQAIFAPADLSNRLGVCPRESDRSQA
jgi:hypothetical protein